MDQSEPGSRRRHCAEINTGCYRGQLTEEGSARLKVEGRNRATNKKQETRRHESCGRRNGSPSPRRPSALDHRVQRQRGEELAQESMSEQKVTLRRVGPSG